MVDGLRERERTRSILTHHVSADVAEHALTEKGAALGGDIRDVCVVYIDMIGSTEYGILGAVIGAAVALIGVHSFVEAAARPVRVALVGNTGIGDSLPCSRPTFAAWSNLSILAAALVFAIWGAMLAAVFDQASAVPVLAVVIGVALTLGCRLQFLTVPATYPRPGRRH